MLGTLTRLAGRMAIAPLFVVAGYDAAKNPGGRPDLAAETIEKMRQAVPIIPDDDELVVRANGALQVAAGTAMALGVMPKVAALALVSSLVPTTLAGHQFWTIDDPQQRAAQRLQFMKNSAIVGGLLLTAFPKK